MMDKNLGAEPMNLPKVPVTEFEVTEGCTLCMCKLLEPEFRYDFYEEEADRWERSPQELALAMVDCQPLAWAVQSIYADIRDEIAGDISESEREPEYNRLRIRALRARLDDLPEEPDEGTMVWLLGLTTSEFEAKVVPEIREWFSKPPDWRMEDDFLSKTATGQGAALAYFREMTAEELGLLGVSIVEGDRPGSTYFAAELRGDIELANEAAVNAGLAVRFKADR